MADKKVKKGTLFKSGDGYYILEGETKIPVEKGTLYKNKSGELYIRGASSQAQPPTPGSEPLDFGEMAGSAWDNIKGSYKFPWNEGGGMGGYGPQVQTFREIMNATNKISERGGYKAGGAVTDLLAPHVPPEVAAAGGYAANVGVQAVPSLVSIAGAKNTLQPLMEKFGKSWMHSALMPGKNEIMSGDAARAVELMLKKYKLVTKGSAVKLEKESRRLAKKIQKKLDDMPEGANVDKKKAFDEIMDALDDELSQATPGKDIDAILDSWAEFDYYHPGDTIPIAEANKIKQGTYSSVGDKSYLGTQEITSGSKKGQMRLAKGLKEGVEDTAAKYGVDDIGKLNNELGENINLNKILSPRVGMEANKDIIGLAALAENPAAAAAMQLDRLASTKSLLAQALYHGGAPAATGLGGTGGLMVNDDARNYISDELTPQMKALIDTLREPSPEGLLNIRR